MKVIDLLNKIANGGEIPNKIKYDNMIYELEYSEFGKEYISNDESDGIILVLDIDIDHLNDEVEIIEEPQEHKIPEKLNIMQEKNIKNNWKWKISGEEHEYNISTPQKIIADKINEIIDYLKENK